MRSWSGIRLLACALFALCAAGGFGASVMRQSSLSPSGFADTETATNVVFSFADEVARDFSVRLELDATPSNCVEVAFGRDADGDGWLGTAETELALGWDCGRWFVVGTNRLARIEAEPSVAVAGRLSWVCTLTRRLRSGGFPSATAARRNCSRNWRPHVLAGYSTAAGTSPASPSAALIPRTSARSPSSVVPAQRSIFISLQHPPSLIEGLSCGKCESSPRTVGIFGIIHSSREAEDATRGDSLENGQVVRPPRAMRGRRERPARRSSM